MAAENASTTYTLDECKKHANDKDCWLVIHGKVYDVTSFLEEHPGGYDIILTSAGA
jgi:cytochrome b involved in lipid metabolism